MVTSFLLQLMASPFAEGLLARGFEVLIMTEPIDEYSLSHLREYEGHPLTSIVKEGLDLCLNEEEKKARTETEKTFEKLCKSIQGTLEKYIEKVFVSGRLVASPCAILANQHAMSGNMERISRAQALRNAPTKDIWGSKRQLEINPSNSIILRMKELFESDPNHKAARDLTWILFETALLQSGFSLDNPAVHTDRIYRMISMGLGLDLAADGDVDVDVEEAKPIQLEEIEEKSAKLFEVD